MREIQFTTIGVAGKRFAGYEINVMAGNLILMARWRHQNFLRNPDSDHENYSQFRYDGKS
ncbi:hypothetical protein QN239_19105 [Mycolicibacterium sp. Y3]